MPKTFIFKPQEGEFLSEIFGVLFVFQFSGMYAGKPRKSKFLVWLISLSWQDGKLVF